ncbi:YifB family Mg chelatase-like AAA ATPase [Jatrophihabitans lederbergiae]|uniref:YifB family Mg chelatase-like AAA ATPase n=1 Tax=Jatrophihabitans lederbergiae TaxID=3075547 RepID=A0ABU2J5E7_9ACTN|nr:YifB family Mg chelatase-like AAA ATPase [Jatrophihabitans sp. DSM 44399]MDT0259956.1 YifB family Mg chelatase-like AAA ATPase [Jatrophihabitans sp. DSM 44399]
MGLARTLSIALSGVSGRLVEVEADLSAGLPGLTFTGLPDVSVMESRDRIRAAVLNSGYNWPNKRITVALLPADLRKNGSMFDLALAVAVLAAAGEVPAATLSEVVWLGELGLDGRLRPTRGVLPAALAAHELGVPTIVVSMGNAEEAALVSGLTVLAAHSLAEVIAALRADGPPLRVAHCPDRPDIDELPDLADVVGQPIARRALEIAAAGAHHLLLQGAPGAGKTMLAERLPSILPPLEPHEALEVTAIHSVAGVLPTGTGLLRRPPLQSPHHTSSMAALVGGGSGLGRPGAASLAHRGVLVLDEAAEFKPTVLDSLRQPLESGTIVLHRTGGAVEYPARFQLVLATNPCPCGAPKDSDCNCRPDARRRYQRRLSGPLLDRIDLRIPVDPVSHADLMGDQAQPESSAVVAERVAAARAAARRRWASCGWSTNAEVPGPVLRSRAWRPPRAALARLDEEVELGRLSARGCDRVLKLAWTLSDLAGTSSPGLAEVSEAVWLRTGRASGLVS